MRPTIAFLVLIWLNGLALASTETVLKLPPPDTQSGKPFNQLLQARRSIRNYQDVLLDLDQLSQLCFSAQGITDTKRGFRSAPSAGAIYPLALYIAVKGNSVKGLKAGIYLYLPETHSLKLIKTGDFFDQIINSALNQSWMKKANAIFIITANPEKMSAKYKDRAERYIFMEAGMSAENLLLQAVNLGLGACAVGAFYDDQIIKILQTPLDQKPLLLIPLGKPEKPF